MAGSKRTQRSVPKSGADLGSGARRIVLVQLRANDAASLPDAQQTQVTARRLTTRVEELTGNKAGSINVFPRFGQFAIEATPSMIEQFSHEPEVEAVMENDAAQSLSK